MDAHTHDRVAAGTLPLRSLSIEECAAFNAELDAAISRVANEASFAKDALARGVNAVVQGDDGTLTVLEPGTGRPSS